MPPDLADLTAIHASLPLPPRLLAGAAGAVLLLAGRRLYRLAVVLPGLLLGVAAGIVIAHVLALAPPVAAGVAVVGGLVGALIAHQVERFAIVVAGVIGGLGAAQLAWPLAARAGWSVAAASAPPWWIWPAAAVVGAITFPFVWRAALVPLTAWIGAVILVQAAGLPPQPLTLGGIALVGVIVQLASGGKKARKEE